MGQFDLLLLNASNLPQLPIYPYAFVQVSAIARRFGLSVRRLDLLQVRREFWRPMLQELIQRHRPRMVGIHLRQQDTLQWLLHANNVTIRPEYRELLFEPSAGQVAEALSPA
ncbi:hypothetical protein KYC5002_26430 [Archangium violaceum]|uniref:hypothetical protein n=1 Tax=Archangium violaceum TaxID=83451 RepID=UPI002B301554|nr:hypothetical protein KYC5002_26430 [Archangium gephyra]